MILVIDNYDSFTFNLVQYLGELGATLQIHRNDKIQLSEITNLAPNGIVISPGPGRPEHAGITVELIKQFAGQIPLLGVCLGHQAIGLAFGGKIVQTPKLMHGKTSAIRHDGQAVLHGLPNPFVATRYHSLAVEKTSLPADLKITAESEDGVIMGLQHKTHAIFGVQFHPESILTVDGKILLRNFLDILN
ncbi:MAG: anthranilate synthase component II [bacterium]